MELLVCPQTHTVYRRLPHHGTWTALDTDGRAHEVMAPAPGCLPAVVREFTPPAPPAPRRAVTTPDSRGWRSV